MSPQMTAPLTSPPAAPARWKQLISLDNRYIAPIFITCILLVGHLSFGILESYQRTLLAIVVSIGTELALGRIFFHKWVHPASAYISGISVGILVRSPAFWPYALCAAISIMSKYVLRIKGRHIWNPSNFGISALLLLAPEAVAGLSIQWGNYLLPMLVIWVLGSVIIWRLRRFHITFTYVASFIAFGFIRSWLTGSPWQSEIAPITGPMYQLFIFFMITDPKTTVRSKKWQCIVVFLVALVEMIMRMNQIVYAPFYALFIVGPTAMLIEIWLDSRRMRVPRRWRLPTNTWGQPPSAVRRSEPPPFSSCTRSVELRSTGQPRAAVPTRFKDAESPMPRSRVTLCVALLALLALAGCKQRDSAHQEASSPPPSASPATAVPAAIPEPTPPAAPSVAAPARPSGPIQFTDVTAQAGIHFKHNTGAFGKKYLPETMGSGACFLDYDNDGWQDILLINSMDWPGHQTGKSYPALYHNNQNGTFTDVTKQAGLALEVYGQGCAVGDYDNDGNVDIYITAVGSNHLFRNLGHGKFVDVTAKAGVADPGFSSSALWFDYDNDGKLDLFVAHYIEWSIATDEYCTLDNKNKSYCTPQRYKGQSATLFHNKGNGTFEDVTRHAGLYDPTSKSLGVAMLDYDNDGWMDLVVSNDTEPNKLYHNNHNGTFTDVGIAAGIAYGDAGTVRAGMGTDAADYDNSGWQSLVIGNFTNEGMALYHNDGSGLFTDEAPVTGIARISTKSLTFGTFFFDYDLDGLPDLLAVNGHVSDDVSVVQPTVKYAQPPHLFRNLGKGRFDEVTAKLGSALPRAIVGRGAAYGDFDNDGDLDLVITANGGPARLLRNDNANENDMLRVKTVGTRSNRDGIGAKVTVKTSQGVRLFGMVKSGSSYLSQSELPLTFGLGKPEEGKRVSLTIVWPSGQKDSIANVEPNQFITVQEGKGVISSRPIVFGTPPGTPAH